MTLDREGMECLRRDLLKFARLQLRDAALAEDAVQEALAAAFNPTAGHAGQASFKTWAFSILRNKIVDLIRERARLTSFSELGGDDGDLDEQMERLFDVHGHWHSATRPRPWRGPEESLQERQFWDAFEVCVTLLPERTARVFKMREFLEFETGEICATLAISVSNCNVILHRARSGLRRCLEAGWFAHGASPR